MKASVDVVSRDRVARLLHRCKSLATRDSVGWVRDEREAPICWASNITPDDR